jgi:hypothetical protein
MKQTQLLFLAALLLGLAGCVDTNNSFGTDFIPDDQKPTAGVYTIDNIPAYTAALDSIPTNARYDYTGVFGTMNVPPFGSLSADLVFRIYPYVGYHDFGENPEFISATLQVVVSGHSFPDESQQNIVQNIKLYQLTKRLHYDTTYFNNSITAADYNSLISLPGTTYNGEDTLNIPLTNEYGAFLLSGTPSDMDSLEHFYEKYRGMVLSVEPLGAQGGRLNKANIMYAKLTLNYKREGVDTSMIYLGDYGMVFNSFSHSSNALADYADPLPAPSQTFYIESFAGVKPVFDLVSVTDSINAFLERNELRPDQLLLNKAELIVPITPGADMDKYPARLGLSRRTISSIGKVAYLPIDDIAGSAFGGGINRSLMTYSFNITHYLQQLLKENTSIDEDDQTKLYLFPLTTVTDSYGYSYTVVDNTTYSYGNFSGYNSLLPVKLQLVYTILY